ncbi:hypothetical protein [Acholeplasma granularum]|uniref:hypothetical protein n=1 Tax=Acholeplasma granularum TaxID=264635 RepID=UPI0004B959D5|nr:hypothetical protein [Acholeplasma granularum]
MIKWHFPLSQNVNRKGLNDSGIETFKGQLLESLTREIIQNTLDAKLDDKDFVIIEFDHFKIKTDTFPDKQGFVNNLHESLIEGESLKDSKTKDFFNYAIKLFEKEDLIFLRISDFHTTGLTGSRERISSNWNNLVKSTGISDKGQSAGGSFGIGKNAPFACSNFHTVFYSTLDLHGIEAYQGVANLISVYNHEKNDYTQGIGQLSESVKLDPVHEQLKIQPGYIRTTPGTDIYIAGFSFPKKEFEEGIIRGVLDNFLYAIHEETLVIKINELKIDKQSLGRIVQYHKSVLKLETIELFELLYSKETTWHYDFKDNQAKLAISLSADGSRRVSAIRKPWMKIQSLAGFSRGIEFKGAFIIVGDKLNKLLRMMENPQHDKWEVDRLDKNLKSIGENTLKEIKKYINEKVQSLISINLEEEQEVYGAADYITLVDEDKKSKGRVKESVTSVQVKKTRTVLNPQTVYDYGMTDAIVDADGEIPDFETVIKTGEKHQTPDSDAEKITVKQGKHVSIRQNQIKLFRDIKSNNIHLHYKSTKDVNSVHFAIHALDEEGTKIKNLLEIVEAYQENEKLETVGHMIYKVRLNGNICDITFKINIKESLSLGVDVYENS